MAQKSSSSRAEKAVNSAKKKSAAAKEKSRGAENAPVKKAPHVKTEYEPVIPAGVMAAIISLGLFVLFLVISINPDGALLRVIKSFVLGMIGQAGFYFSIPALLYLFAIHTFGRRTDVVLRSVSTILFVLTCGSIFHLMVQTQGMSSGFSLVTDLYRGGNDGLTGGLICGGMAMLVRWACGPVVSYLIFGLAAVFSLLGAMQITLPSIIRAIANRPRDDDWDEEDEQNYVEPATIVVNHIANKQIEHRRQRRQRMEEARLEESQAVQLEEVQPGEPEAPAVGTPANASSMMNVIGLDIEAPIDGGEASVEPEKKHRKAQKTDQAPEVEEFPKDMPELDLDEDIPVFVPRQEPAAEKPLEKPAEKSAEKPASGKVTASQARESARLVAEEIEKAGTAEKPEYHFPPIELLKRPPRASADGTEEMRENSRRLNETLASFKIDAHIINVTRGPSVTRYEVELDKGVRLNKLTGCADDIALSLGASGVRIAAVPGKISVVGIEVPNRSVTTVSLREVIDSPEFSKARSHSSFAVGKDIGGSCIVGNIAKMPHLLIAGTTGSGKSVCMNSVIISLLYKSSPEEVKLIMVDPKMVELGIYNGIPHLLIPVVTDPKKAAGSLQWAVTEMMRRYKMMSDAGVRDLESYNSIMQAEEEDGQTLPQVVIIIDELADLMLVAAKEVEDSICRIAQMGRAAGMHLIIATQRPSADVITGLMKANIPSRIAFSVASAMESRIILDTTGAEKLVGKGDMLYAPIGIGKPLRVQGCFVTDGEVEAVAGYVKENYVADYSQEVLEEIEKKAQQTGKKSASGSVEPTDEELDGDEMLPAAVEVILETGQASVSMLQRRLKLGYARAARIVDEMEEKGIVGPFQGSKPRSILITKEQWAARKGGDGQMGFDDFGEDSGVPDEID